MRRLLLLLVDLFLIALATVSALFLRDNFEVSQARLEAFVPYLLLALAVAAAVLPALRTSHSFWRFTGMADYSRLLAATIAIVAGTVALGFAFNRMEGIARAMPILQGLLILFALVGVRILARLRHAVRDRPVQLKTPATAEGGETVLVAGLNRLTELYLRSVAEFAPNRVRIAGLLGRGERHTGRFVHRHPVLGTPEQVASVLRDLEVHGVFVDRIVVTSAFDKLSPEAQQVLLEVERTTSIHLTFLAETMGLYARSIRAAGDGSAVAPGSDDDTVFSICPDDLAALARRPYWRIKRALDLIASSALLIVLTPVMLLIAILVAIDVGVPVAFWQQRPGLGGQPFRLYKFRSMADAHDARGRRVPDSERSSPIGRLLRRTRFDELPQLFNILLGEMSFIGPRPLLPVDQPVEYIARLLVRPGLTGWAQVNGGREVSAADKAALDVWYVHNASSALDLEILLRTVPMVIFGERANAAAIQRAWRELQQAGICTSRELVAGPSDLVASAGVTGAKRAA